MIIQALSDTDKYKLLMMCERFFHENGKADVRWKFTNRTFIKPEDQHLMDEALISCVEELKQMDQMKFSEKELDFFADEERFGSKLPKEFIDFLRDFRLDANSVSMVGEELYISNTWVNSLLFETYVLSIVNEKFTASYAKKYNIQLMSNAMANIKKKVDKLNAIDAIIPITEFGTRRRASYDIQLMVIKNLRKTKQFKGTSNMYIAMELDIPCVGTMAHELFMGEAAIAYAKDDCIRKSHQNMLVRWNKFWDGEANVLLSDTFGTDAFMDDLVITGLVNTNVDTRHDSGDPVVFARKMIKFYKRHGINPKDRTIVFSDGLTIDKCIELYDLLNDEINVAFGVGTSLTNECGGFPLSIVMKLESVIVNEIRAYTVKLSDNKGKHLGRMSDVAFYKNKFDYENKEENNLEIIY